MCFLIISIQLDISTKSQRTADIINILVNIYGSQDMFVSQYRILLADRILNNYSYDVTNEVSSRLHSLFLVYRTKWACSSTLHRLSRLPFRSIWKGTGDKAELIFDSIELNREVFRLPFQSSVL